MPWALELTELSRKKGARSGVRWRKKVSLRWRQGSSKQGPREAAAPRTDSGSGNSCNSHKAVVAYKPPINIFYGEDEINVVAKMADAAGWASEAWAKHSRPVRFASPEARARPSEQWSRRCREAVPDEPSPRVTRATSLLNPSTLPAVGRHLHMVISIEMPSLRCSIRIL